MVPDYVNWMGNSNTIIVMMIAMIASPKATILSFIVCTFLVETDSILAQIEEKRNDEKLNHSFFVLTQFYGTLKGKEKQR